jgi:hypothetical protein
MKGFSSGLFLFAEIGISASLCDVCSSGKRAERRRENRRSCETVISEQEDPKKERNESSVVPSAALTDVQCTSLRVSRAAGASRSDGISCRKAYRGEAISRRAAAIQVFLAAADSICPYGLSAVFLPPLCKGRWIAKRDGRVVSVAARTNVIHPTNMKKDRKRGPFIILIRRSAGRSHTHSPCCCSPRNARPPR